MGSSGSKGRQAAFLPRRKRHSTDIVFLAWTFPYFKQISFCHSFLARSAVIPVIFFLLLQSIRSNLSATITNRFNILGMPRCCQRRWSLEVQDERVGRLPRLAKWMSSSVGNGLPIQAGENSSFACWLAGCPSVNYGPFIAGLSKHIILCKAMQYWFRLRMYLVCKSRGQLEK